MNPTLTQWLDNYNAARAQYMDETRLLPVDALMPERPREMQFTITSTGLLRDADGRRVGHATEMNEAAFNALGLEMGNLTARQRRAPVTRAQRREAAIITAAEELETELDALNDTPRRHDEAHIPDDAAPGDVVTYLGTRIGIVGRNGRNEVVVVRDPNPMHDRLRRQVGRMEGTIPIPDEFRGVPVVIGADPALEEAILTNLNAAISNTTIATTLNSTMSNSRSRALAEAEANAAALRATRPQTEPPLYVGPRMLATIAQPAASAERYAQHTVDGTHAHLRAGQIYHQRPALIGAAVRRAREDSPNGTMVDRNAAAVLTFLSEGYGIELNEEALTAVTAMINYMVRQSALPLIARAEQAEESAARLRTSLIAEEARTDALMHADADAQHSGNIVGGVITSTTDPGPVEAAVAAARAWKETPVTDSVAKLNSFKHLLDTLEQLAR